MRDPAELCGSGLADRSAVESLLFDAFIPAAYRHVPADGWKEQDVERWLAFLACQLESTIGKPELAWWELRQTIPNFARATAIVYGAAVGFVVWIAVWIGVQFLSRFTIVVATASWIIVAAIAARVERRRAPRKPVRGLQWQRLSRRKVVPILAVGAVSWP